MDYGQLADRIGAIASIEESNVKIQLIGHFGAGLKIRELNLDFVSDECDICTFRITKIALQGLCDFINNPGKM